ncbi:MAG: hypothetical protein CML13_17430 [Puniceicoccaceae bacterium]|nr:hypothetical protein [Puniceicoccaceae bacterium]
MEVNVLAWPATIAKADENRRRRNFITLQSEFGYWMLLERSRKSRKFKYRLIVTAPQHRHMSMADTSGILIHLSEWN